MSEQEIRVPDLGGADEVEVIELLVSAGDSVEAEDPILTVETDKASVELPSPGAGKIIKLTVKVGDKVKEGDVVGTMESSGDSAGATEGSGSQPEQKPEEAPEARQESKPAPKKQSGGSRKETVLVPPLDGMEKVPVIEINVSEGDVIEADDALVTVESDKASMEIPSPYGGKVVKILVAEGDKLSEGDKLLELMIEGGEGEDQDEEPDGVSEAVPAQDEKSEAKADEKVQGKEPAPQSQGSVYEPPGSGSKVHAGPAVRKLARELGADMTRIKGSGPKGRILKDDVQTYVKSQLQQAQQSGSVASGSGIPGVKLPDFSQFGDIQKETMSRMMAVTAANMQRSWLNVPHVTQFEDADITDMEAFRKSQKAAGEKKGVKMTPLPFLLKACATALAELPQFNVSLDMERKEVIRKQYIHIGIAVDTPNGLMVPVIRDVDKKGLWELAAESAELAQKARDKKLKPAEMQGACFTITSLGGIGGTAFTPIVNAPEVAILGVSRAAMKPVWDGSEFQPRLMLPLSLSYDHRAVNGADAARFTSLLGQLLGDIRTLLL
ncbi:dihydrolipoyllysine-residue acetyltransferase [Marinobacter sp. ANT_B65]|uniref:dihydrolipoyllysine-residue acetyltransferase n=1 Tax=Marinobacter sp. ANT_B65 TaxID=2039467 RepID=UPI000BBE4B6F|nr:dihydrolipoyllysine-residue acetyltransferase [Marinobacter sp. ANT_B65]PCM44613.1 dihydrolipoyllysine-residue acetyltransferase [Marinobacter sp. ANT_B65]